MVFPKFCDTQKNDTIRFVTDFRVLNEKLKRKPYPLPLIQDILHNLGSFKYATCIDLNMGYYSMRLDEESQKKCVTCLPWGLYAYKMLPMGLKIASDVFQEAMGELFNDMEEVIVYIDDILVIGTDSYKKHLAVVQEVLTRLEDKGMQVNADKSSWAKPEVEYLGFLITREGIKPQRKKIQGILDMSEPKTTKQVRGFIGMVNYYKTLWPRRSKIMSPLTALTGQGTKFQWRKEHQIAFQEAKTMIAQDALLTHPNFRKRFDVHTDASKYQIGGVVSQENKPIAYFSKKLNTAQRNYTVTGKELLSIVETLKAFKSILLGNQVKVYTDHKNLTYQNSDYSSDRILRQRLVIEEYGAELTYIKGENNIVADALSRLPMTAPKTEEATIKEELFLQKRVFEDQVAFPLDLAKIEELQRNDNQLTRMIAEKKGGKRFKKDDRQGLKLWTYEDKIFVPKEARAPMIEWYHENLQHAGSERTAKTMRQHFNWPGAVEHIKKYIKKCPKCQMFKITGVKKYGKIPLPDNNDTDTIPFHTIQVDMIGPWSVKFATSGKAIKRDLQALTIVDRATGWPELIPTKTKESLEVSELFDNQWLCRYPRPVRVIHDNGSEFIGMEFQEMLSSYGIKPEPTSVKNPRGNAIIERMHLTAGDMLRTMEFDGANWFYELDRVLQIVAWAIRSTVSTTINYSPGQLVFSKDMIMQSQVTANWELIKQIKRESTIKSNADENRSRLLHAYQPGDKVLILRKANNEIIPKLAQPTEGPYTVEKVYRNGIVKIKRGSYSENIHIRRIKPYHE